MKVMVKMKSFFVSAILLFTNLGFCQTGQWTWMGGDSGLNKKVVYGSQGVASPHNSPGARAGSYTFTDDSGNFWLFGGSGPSGILVFNDLWKYNPSLEQWVWVKGDSVRDYNSQSFYSLYGTQGVSSPTNKPARRMQGVSWADNSGHLWIFGGNGSGPNNLEFLNELWKYNLNTNEWTWMKGDTAWNAKPVYGIKGTASIYNNPCFRRSCASFKDNSGNLWIFGGDGYASNGEGFLNDLWKYNPNTNEWTWMAGDSVKDATAKYGSLKIASVNNCPGSRVGCTGWTDSSGMFWIFGGVGKTTSDGGNLNDLWKFNPNTNEWTWVKGDSIVDMRSIYGSLGIASTSNKPGGRLITSNWTIAKNELYTFGGDIEMSGNHLLNDLWKYNINTDEWIWVKGDSSENVTDVYGMQGIASLSGNPGARRHGATWMDSQGNLWLFGGNSNGWNYYSDLWKYIPANALPVHLLSLTAQLQDKQTHLNWTVEAEQNFDRYEVERSLNGKDFTKIGFVKAINKRSYSYYDNIEAFKNQKVYYRLKMIDKDGKFDYSNIVLIKLSSNNLFTIVPNPANKSCQLQFDKSINEKVSIEIMDATGKIVMIKSYEPNGNNIPVSTEKLHGGTYTLRLFYKREVHLQQLVVVK